MCRIAYEIMNSLHLDASTKYTSLDNIYYYEGQNRRQNKAILSHTADEPSEIDLQVDDQISVINNNWNGYSDGTNLRTNKSGLFPTFKVLKNSNVRFVIIVLIFKYLCVLGRT